MSLDQAFFSKPLIRTSLYCRFMKAIFGSVDKSIPILEPVVVWIKEKHLWDEFFLNQFFSSRFLPLLMRVIAQGLLWTGLLEQYTFPYSVRQKALEHQVHIIVLIVKVDMALMKLVV